jgi:GNAT superfamily N-acetyltransferase
MSSNNALPTGWSIREAGVADLPIVLQHRDKMFREMGFSDPAALKTAAALATEFFARDLADGNYRGWFVVDQTGAVAAGGGVVLLRYHANPRDPFERRLVVVNVYTEPTHRRRGFARLLMRQMTAWSRAQGFRSLYLHAAPAGRRLYESLGFTPTNEMRLDLSKG